MIKIIGISSSPRDGATDFGVKKSLEEANKFHDIKTEIVYLRNRELNYCIHCDACIKNNSKYCLVHKENNEDLYNKFFKNKSLCV